MLVFSTILNINQSLTEDKFIELVIKWNQGSPHEDNIIPNIKWEGERNISYKHEDSLQLDIEEYRNKRIIASRFIKKEDSGVIWTTDYVMNFNEMKMSVRLDKSFTDEALEMSGYFSTPHFITLLIEGGYLESDNGLAVDKTAFIVNKENIEMLASVINGEADYNLPIVYVSKLATNSEPVEIEKLSRLLKGVAHVLVQENKNLNSLLREKCHDKNEYYGAVGIYYPKQLKTSKRLLDSNKEVMLKRIFNAVVRYSNAQETDPLYTWQGVQNALLRDKLESQKEKRQKLRFELSSAETETNQILEELEEEMQKLEKKVEDLTNDNERLSRENFGLKNKIDSQSGVQLLNMGNENELYPGEAKDLVLYTLSEVLQSKKGTRRYEIIADIIESNNYQKATEQRREELKGLLKSYNGMSKKIRNGLKDLGFEITEDGKHYKLVYYGDGRYTFAIAKTPSDTRAGKNNVSEISKKVF